MISLINWVDTDSKDESGKSAQEYGMNLIQDDGIQTIKWLAPFFQQ